MKAGLLRRSANWKQKKIATAVLAGAATRRAALRTGRCPEKLITKAKQQKGLLLTRPITIRLDKV